MIYTKTLVLIIVLLLNSLQAIAISNNFYDVTPDKISRTLGVLEFNTQNIEIRNRHNTQLDLRISVEGNLKDIIELSDQSLTVQPGQTRNFSLTIFARELGELNGLIRLSGDVNEELPVNVLVSGKAETDNLLIKTQSDKKKLRLATIYSLFSSSTIFLLKGALK